MGEGAQPLPIPTPGIERRDRSHIYFFSKRSLRLHLFCIHYGIYLFLQLVWMALLGDFLTRKKAYQILCPSYCWYSWLQHLLQMSVKAILFHQVDVDVLNWILWVLADAELLSKWYSIQRRAIIIFSTSMLIIFNRSLRLWSSLYKVHCPDSWAHLFLCRTSHN